MKCEKCGKNEATMYYKETVNGVTREDAPVSGMCTEGKTSAVRLKTHFSR